jgi:hypothetical protein
MTSKFKTLRHIETVRNFINSCVKELLTRGEKHDASKLEDPESSTFEVYTDKLRDVTYGSPEFNQLKNEMAPALAHHYANNPHHPEHFKNGIRDMTLIDLVEMFCDWKASSLRHNDGNILKSIEINQIRFGYSEDLKLILENTAKWLEQNLPAHKANES